MYTLESFFSLATIYTDRPLFIAIILHAKYSYATGNIEHLKAVWQYIRAKSNNRNSIAFLYCAPIVLLYLY